MKVTVVSAPKVSKKTSKKSSVLEKNVMNQLKSSPMFKKVAMQKGISMSSLKFKNLSKKDVMIITHPNKTKKLSLGKQAMMKTIRNNYDMLHKSLK